MLWRRRSALLVDFENLYREYRSSQAAFLGNIKNWLTWIEDGEFDPSRVRRRLVAKRVFWNTQHDIHRQLFVKHGFEVEVCRAIRKEKASSADFDMTIQAVELHRKHPGIEEFIILSLDTDFSSVLVHLQKDDCAGVAMVGRRDASGDSASTHYQRILDIAIDRDEFLRAFNYTPESRSLFGGKRAREPVSIPSATAAPAAQPKLRAQTPAPAGQGQRRSAQTPTFDLDAAARIIVAEADETQSTLVSRPRVVRILSRIEGFAPTGRHVWLGCGSYRKMIDEFIRREPRLHLRSTHNGGVVLGCTPLLDQAGAQPAE